MTIELTGRSILFEGKPVNGRYPAVAASGGAAALAWESTTADGLPAIRITTDGTHDFGTPVNPKYRTVALADDDFVPNTTFGRDNAVLAGPVGAASTAQVAPGASKSYVEDISENASGGGPEVVIGTGSPRFTYFRRQFLAYTPQEAATFYVWAQNLTNISPGDTITGRSSGTTAVVSAEGYANQKLSLEKDQGSVGAPDYNIFADGEVIDSDSGGTADVLVDPAIGTTNYDLNHKYIRIWQRQVGFGTGENPNQYLLWGQIQHEASTAPTEKPPGSFVEYADDSANSQGLVRDSVLNNPLADVKSTWVTEKLLFANETAIGALDGYYEFISDGATIHKRTNVLHKDGTASDEDLNTIYNTQIAGGPRPGTTIYMDQQVANDSYFWLELEDEATGKTQPLFPKTWVGDDILAYDTSARLSTWTRINIYKDDGGQSPVLVARVAK